jgi:hypothetical protein
MDFAQCPADGCHARILIVPDLAAMRKAIDRHAELHSNPEDIKRILAERTMLSIIRSHPV